MVTGLVVVDTPISTETDYQVSVIATSPAQAPVVWSLPLSWKLAGLSRPDVRMSSGVKAWVNYSTLFSNWLYSCLTVFVATSVAELTIPVPDQFIDDLDVTGLTFCREYEKGGNEYIKIYA
jgi:hypothetical protein